MENRRIGHFPLLYFASDFSKIEAGHLQLEKQHFAGRKAARGLSQMAQFKIIADQRQLDLPFKDN